ncbi:MAG: phosphoadenosine phosphosulfate reductase family protein [Methylophilales bacterium]|jgi:phosphoadenosine phosphosulfate reductase|nr:phosphoadenosine phosphosulfate reductase family protein [bacterium]|tara:strand:- start:842 stop:1468 length:627 start_codon:yes stop_codon:yes gene_type:complete
MSDLKKLNKDFSQSTPEEIIRWAFNETKNPIITTNFRPYEVAILHLCTCLMPNLKVIWCDSGYNTRATYLYAEKIIKELDLNIKLYIPKHTAAFREAVMGKMPEINDPRHKEFTEQVKLEPFRRAMAEIKPDLWVTNLRKGQTVFRDELDIFNKTETGLLKISPFYYWTDTNLDAYMEKYNLVNEHDYFDPTKVDEKRECGLHNLEGK